MEASNLSSILANTWLSKVDEKLKEKILLASLLQETGKFILSELIISENKSKLFIQALNNGEDLIEVEKRFLGITTSKATAEIFKYWKLSSNLIKTIEFVDDIENCPIKYKQKDSTNV